MNLSKRMMKSSGWLLLALAAPSMAAAAVLATVGKKQLTDEDLRAALSQFNDGQKGNILKDRNNRRQLLGTLIEQEILFQEAERQRAGDNDQVKAAVDAFRRQQMVAFLLDKALAARLNEGAARKFYEKNRTKFSTDQVRAQHILTQTEAEARELLKKVREPSADFQKIAEQVSRDPSAKNNRGELGYFTRDQLVEEFTQAAFKASTGDIVGPVRTMYGYHVIRVMDKKLGRIQNFEEVELKVRALLRQKLVAEYVDTLRGRSGVKIDNEAIEKL
jgi:peptidyl-prolyl cis-trans isomerase C